MENQTPNQIKKTKSQTKPEKKRKSHDYLVDEGGNNRSIRYSVFVALVAVLILRTMDV